ATDLVMPERSGALWMVTTVGLATPGMAGSSEGTGVVISLDDAKAWLGICVPLASGVAMVAVSVSESDAPGASGFGQLALSTPPLMLAVPPLLTFETAGLVRRGSMVSFKRTLVAFAVPSLGMVSV